MSKLNIHVVFAKSTHSDLDAEQLIELYDNLDEAVERVNSINQEYDKAIRENTLTETIIDENDEPFTTFTVLYYDAHHVSLSWVLQKLLKRG